MNNPESNLDNHSSPCQQRPPPPPALPLRRRTPTCLHLHLARGPNRQWRTHRQDPPAQRPS